MILDHWEIPATLRLPSILDSVVLSPNPLSNLPIYYYYAVIHSLCCFEISIVNFSFCFLFDCNSFVRGYNSPEFKKFSGYCNRSKLLKNFLLPFILSNNPYFRKTNPLKRGDSWYSLSLAWPKGSKGCLVEEVATEASSHRDATSSM